MVKKHRIFIFFTDPSTSNLKSIRVHREKRTSIAFTKLMNSITFATKHTKHNIEHAYSNGEADFGTRFLCKLYATTMLSSSRMKPQRYVILR